MDKGLEIYFYCRITKLQKEECWIWKGTIHESGYGVVSYKGKRIPAHKVSLMIKMGNELRGKTILHSCFNRSCVNPDHLYVGGSGIPKECAVCGKIFKCRRDKIKTSKCCSIHCRSVYSGTKGRQKQLALWEKDTHEEFRLKMRDSLERFIERTNYCWLWTGSTKGRKKFPYGNFTFRGKNYLAHRAMYISFKGKIPEGLLVLHKCDNPSCVNPDHLYLGTHIDNQRDKLKRGRCKGEKLTIKQVKEIKKKLGEGVMVKRLCVDYDVSRTTIHSIKTGKTWRDIS